MKAPFGCGETLRRVIVDGEVILAKKLGALKVRFRISTRVLTIEARYRAIDRIATFRLDEEVDPQRMVRCLGQKRREELTGYPMSGRGNRVGAA